MREIYRFLSLLNLFRLARKGGTSTKQSTHTEMFCQPGRGWDCHWAIWHTIREVRWIDTFNPLPPHDRSGNTRFPSSLRNPTSSGAAGERALLCHSCASSDAKRCPFKGFRQTELESNTAPVKCFACSLQVEHKSTALDSYLLTLKVRKCDSESWKHQIKQCDSYRGKVTL